MLRIFDKMNTLSGFQRILLILSLVVFFLCQFRVETDYIIILWRTAGVYAISALIMYIANRFVENKYLVARRMFGVVGVVLALILMVRF